MQGIVTAIAAIFAAFLIFIFFFPHLWTAVVFVLKLGLLGLLVTAVVAAYVSRDGLRRDVDAGKYDMFLAVFCAIGAVGSFLAFVVALLNEGEIVFTAAAFLPYGLLSVYFGTRAKLPVSVSPVSVSPVSVSPASVSPTSASPASVPSEQSPNSCEAVTGRLIENINLALPSEGWLNGFTVAHLLGDKLKTEIIDTLARHQHNPDWGSSAHVLARSEEYLHGLSPTERFLAHFCDGTDFKKFLASYRAISIPDHLRFRHQFIIDPAGTGKTALLSAQIYYDLFKVAEGKCSVFIMDSQNELIPSLARSTLFTKGRALYGKLVYIDPSPATFHIPNASMVTLQELLSERGQALIEQHLRHLDTNEELSTPLHDKEFAVTRSAVRNRIDAMLANQIFRAMFSQPHNHLDLFNELREPKVVLINTNKALLKNASGPFGRFFLAKLLQAIEERMIDPKAQRLPVFCYINEAGDYLGADANVEEFLDGAIKQDVSLTFAVQKTEHIKSPNMLAALKGCAVQAWTEKPHHWNFALRGIGTAHVNLPNIDLSKGDLISDADFEKLKLEMWHKYGGLPVERPKSAGSASAAA